MANIDPKNNCNITGRLTKDPEILKGTTIVGSVAVDFAANDRTNNPNTTGFFNFVYFLDGSSNAEFVRKQIESGNLKKGSGVILVGKLRQARWDGTDGKVSSGFEIEAHALTYAGFADTRPNGQAAAAGGGSAVTAPEEF